MLQYGDEYKNERRCCIIREYVEGVTLTEYARTNILSREEIVRIAMELAGAMKFLHESDPVIIHRDIKPDNIIIRADKSLVLIDFGISRLIRRAADRTPFSAAPEITRRRSSTVLCRRISARVFILSASCFRGS